MEPGQFSVCISFLFALNILSLGLGGPCVWSVSVCMCEHVCECVCVFLGSNYPHRQLDGRLGGLVSAPGWFLPSLKPCFLWLFVAFCWVLVELVERSPGSHLLGRQKGAGSIGFRGWSCTLTTNGASSVVKPWASGRLSGFLALPLNLGFFLRF